MIGHKVLEEAKEMIGNLLSEYKDEISEAYLKSDSGIRIGVAVKFEPVGPDAQLMTVKLSFVSSRIRAEYSKTVSEAQGELLIPDAMKRLAGRLRPRKGSSAASITFSSGDKSVTMEQPK